MDYVTLLVVLLLTFALAAVSARQFLTAVFQLMQRSDIRSARPATTDDRG
jgi:hypothetical protein